ncbi:MAG: hypothetical protein AAFX99_01460, partial [Myxococcota bacterium]
MPTLEQLIRRGSQLYQQARARLQDHTKSHWEALSRRLTPGAFIIEHLDTVVDRPFPTSTGSLYADELRHSLISPHGPGRYDCAFSHLLWLKPLGPDERRVARVDHILSFQLDATSELNL